MNKLSSLSPNNSYPDFFQVPPQLGDQWLDDEFLQNVVKRLINNNKNTLNNENLIKEIYHDLSLFGSYCGGDLHNEAENCEKNPPNLINYDAWGNRIDHILTNNSWKHMHIVAAREGLIATGYERKYGNLSRCIQFAKLYLFGPSSGLYSCPLAMTDGATRLMELLLQQHSLGKLNFNAFQLDEIREAFTHLTSRDPNQFWTSGQWMTERGGGSDVGSGTRTIARIDSDGYYRLYGFKWFTSATDSDITVTLARIEDAKTGLYGEGSKGISCFLVRLRDENGRLNNIQVCKLKNKLGTKQLPTAELELLGTRAILISEPGRGIAFISSLINITRLYNTIASAGGMRRGIQLQRDYMNKRVVFGKKLSDNSLHLESIADCEIQARGALLIAMDGALKLGKAEMNSSNTQEIALLRLITPLAKLYTAKQAVAVASEILESFGGAGYIEDTGLPRLLRDAQVLPIWEGTTNVLSHDVLRVIKQDKGKSVNYLFQHVINNCNLAMKLKDNNQFNENQYKRIESLSKNLINNVSTVTNYVELSSKSNENLLELERYARDLSFALSRLYIASLFIEHSLYTNNWIDWVATERWSCSLYSPQGNSIILGPNNGFIPVSIINAVNNYRNSNNNNLSTLNEISSIARGPIHYVNNNLNNYSNSHTLTGTGLRAKL